MIVTDPTALYLERKVIRLIALSSGLADGQVVSGERRQARKSSSPVALLWLIRDYRNGTPWTRYYDLGNDDSREVIFEERVAKYQIDWRGDAEPGREFSVWVWSSEGIYQQHRRQEVVQADRVKGLSLLPSVTVHGVSDIRNLSEYGADQEWENRYSLDITLAYIRRSRYASGWIDQMDIRVDHDPGDFPPDHDQIIEVRPDA